MPDRGTRSRTRRVTRPTFSGYHVLMPTRVQNVLLVASVYDSFILEEDGRFSDRIHGEYLEMHLSRAPDFHRAHTADEALRMIASHRFDLVITTSHLRGMAPPELARRAKEIKPDLPVVLLTYSRQETLKSPVRSGEGSIDLLLLWTGNPRILLALVKLVEDRLNLAHDTRHGRVRVILVVEDSPAFYSALLPIIFEEVMMQTRSLMGERLNEADRIARMRARPKIVLARTYEEAKRFYEEYRELLLCLITDIRFPRDGKPDSSAGLKLIQEVQERDPGIPILLESAEPRHRFAGQALRVTFADKNSPDLLHVLRRFMVEHLGFGPFLFKDPDGQEVARARDLPQLVKVLRTVPLESLRRHAERNDFSNWLRARSEFALADELRPRQLDDFRDLEHLRSFLVRRIGRFLQEEQQGKISDFHRGGGHQSRDFARLGTGSLGGKARGIAFMGSLLARHPIHDEFPEVRVFTPRTVVVCTDHYDRFTEGRGLREQAIRASSDEKILELFLAHALEPELEKDLKDLLHQVRYPLAVRSSSLLEDSHHHPFAGIYTTYLLPNNDPDPRVRLEELSRAIRMIYASTFSGAARSYMRATGQRQEEEKMAVVIQRLVGRAHDDLFYPAFAGVARSHNFYPVGRMKASDGVASVALGLGRTVVEGGQALHFCPRYPRSLLQMSTTEEALRSTQREFYALNLADAHLSLDGDDAATLCTADLARAERDGTLAYVGATYSPEDDRIHDALHREGVRLVNFAPVLKYQQFPLAPLLTRLLDLTEEAVGTPVEMEFACLLQGRKKLPEMAVLQIRPLVSQSWSAEVDVDRVAEDEAVLIRGRALGGGVVSGIHDVVYVHPDRFDVSQSREVAAAVGEVNRHLVGEGRGYLLVGPGRWGTADRWLGIPAAWHQISGARIITELAVPGFRVDPSQGTHFFHNITSLRIGYFTVDLTRNGEWVDLEFLESLPAITESSFLRHVRLEHPLAGRISSREGLGVVVRLPARVHGSSDAIPAV